jgi:hypothetical protein
VVENTRELDPQWPGHREHPPTLSYLLFQGLTP